MSRKNSWLLLFFICLLASMASAQTAERNMKKEEEIWHKLEAISPASVENFKKATEAIDSGNVAEAARLYEEVFKAARLYEKVFKKAPGFDIVMRRYGSSLVDLGKRKEGIALLEKAIKENPSPENHKALAQACMPQEGQEVTTIDLDRAFQSAKGAYDRNLDNDDSSYAVLLAQIALQVDNKKAFRDAVKTLALYHPDLMQTHYYKAMVAAMDKQWIEAEEEVEKAERLGLSHEKATALLNSGIKRKAAARHYVYYALYFLAAWLTGLALLFLLGKALSKMTLRWIEKSDPNARANNGHRLLRKWYRGLLTVGGLYYYFSMPLVLLITLVIFGFSIHALFKLNNTPVKFFALLGIGVLVTIYSLIRSLLVRTKVKDPGRSLGKEEAPKLWALTQEVAAQIGTRPIDEIRLTPGTDMSVYERGSFRERVQDRAHRVLILGVATLNDFKINSFRAILAHEYGHFTHRDTAGGEVAIRVNRDMMNFALAMVAQNQAVPWNVVFQFLRLYHFIYRRISHGATRFQEVMADRVAVRIYGASDFEEGLCHIIRREVEFEDSSYWEIANASKERRTLQNFYEVKTVGENIEEKIREVINRVSTEDDTHPAPAERFRLAKRIVSSEVPSAEGMVWGLFNDKDGLTNEMSQLIERLILGRGYKG
jgi:Zn-dependent protease with chaperone function